MAAIPLERFFGKTKFDKVEIGDGEVTGTLKCAVLSPDANTPSNVLSHDLNVGAGYDIIANAGEDNLDYALSTGTFDSPSGANTLHGNVTVTAGKKVTKGATIERSLTKTAGYTITDTDPDLIFIGAILAHSTIVLPTAADNAGRTITVIIVEDPGTYNVVLDGEGAETINGAATKTNSDIYSMLKVTCNGTGWFIVASAGTWT